MSEQPSIVEIVAETETQALDAAAGQFGVAADELQILESRSPSAWPWQRKRVFYTVGRKPAPSPPANPDGTWSVAFER